MKNQSNTLRSSARPGLSPTAIIAWFLLVLVFVVAVQSSHAGSATWLATPVTGDWNTAANWTAGGPPNGGADTATFASSPITDLSLSDTTNVNEILFNPGASAFTITARNQAWLTISGVGITNNSGITQNFVNAVDATTLGIIFFEGNATAGSLTAFTNQSGASLGTPRGIVCFDCDTPGGTATAGNGTFTNNGASSFEAFGGATGFSGSATAGNATIISNGGTVSGANGGETTFAQSSTLGNATLIANGGLDGGAHGGGLISMFDASTGGTARVETFGNGAFSIDYTSAAITIGSLEGDGVVTLGGNSLTVGANQLSTTFAGVISGAGSLTKIGSSKLTLSGANTYAGGTTVSKGTLLVTNRSGSATGTGAVTVNGGTLGGAGKISGAVTIGTATSGARLAPGSGTKPGKLTLSTTLTFNARANYKVDLNSTLVRADQVAARGVTINTGATVTIGDLGTGTLTAGTVFTIINNTAATAAIAGTFSNLADGSTLTIGGNTYLVSYEGGTGNDLTLTVVQ